MRARIAATVAVAAVVAGAVVLLSARDSSAPRSAAPSPERTEEALRGSPPALQALHEQAGEFLDGGPDAFRERLKELRGHPVVVNKWASWCGPCRAEFPFFQRQSVARGKEVAFIGVNALDSDAEAAEFAREFPVSYPHYRDPDQEVAKVFKGNAGFPTTAFYDARGELVASKQGGYASEAKLIEDLDRYTR